MHELRTLGLDENTLVIFTSDNGSRCAGEGGSNGVLRGTKGSTWEGGLRVPCIMRWPGHIPAGATCSQLVSSMDFYPTLAAIGGAALPTDRIIDGKDLLPLIRSGGSSPTPREDFFYYMRNTLEAVRSDNWKLHVRKKDQPTRELYDLASDPGETQNVYERHPEIIARLSAKLEACRADIGDSGTNVTGRNCRPVGHVAVADTLTHLDPEHPYIIAMYDLKDRG
jgi:arylsulfatase A-like enzyme